ncbi:hypothetical protein QTP86_005471 [Hemibagrus guttatus]|nr:hypothetical protein QTP86_005471 [Hemibagrus guttatus]
MEWFPQVGNIQEFLVRRYVITLTLQLFQVTFYAMNLYHIHYKILYQNQTDKTEQKILHWSIFKAGATDLDELTETAKEDAFRNGDRVLYNQARNTLNKEIRVAKRSYAKKLEKQFSSNDPASMWKGLKYITNYKTPSPSTEANQQLAEDLNEFYCRFETAGLTPHARSEHLSTQPLVPPETPVSPYRANRSMDDAVNMGLHFILQHLHKSGTYVRLLFVDFSSAFNTIIPTLLWTKLTQLFVPSFICQWITSFLRDRHQLVKLGKFTSNSRTTSTGTPQGCVLSPPLFSLYTNNCTSTVKLLKFTDNTTVIGLIQDGEESAYRQEVEQLAVWCSLNNLELNNSGDDSGLQEEHPCTPHHEQHCTNSGVIQTWRKRMTGCQEMWYCMRKSGVAEKYVRVVQDMYERSRTVVRCAVGQTEEFNVEVGLHQGSALSPFLFAMVMDQLSEEVRQESPWTMMFADDIVICSESREQVEENLERWRFALERRGMKVSGSKTEYMCVNEREGSGTVRLQGEEVKKVQEFKYLGSTVQSNGECGKEYKRHLSTTSNSQTPNSTMAKTKELSKDTRNKIVDLHQAGKTESAIGKGRELADVMERRKVDILCVQETRWKGSKARSIGAGFKLFYYGVDSKRNGVGVVLKEEFVRNVLEVGCELEEKERFWSELDEVMESIPTGERVVIGADFNGHVGEGNTGDEEVMGKFGVKERNLEGQMVVDFAKRMDMGVVNTYFQKREEHRVTYKSGGRRTQMKRQKLRQALGGQVVLPDDWETTAEVIRETGRKVLGVSSGRRKEDKETWWWNEEVQDSIQRKRLAKKKWDMDRTEENRQEYKELQRRVKREVSKAKQKAYEELYTRLDTREGEKDLYRLARQRDRDGKDVQQVRVIKDRDGRVLTSEESVQRRWKEYFEELMNEENEREKRVEGVNSVEQKVDKIRKDEVRKALKRMKSGKAVGPDDIPVEVWKCLGEAAVEFLANLFNRVLENLEKAYDRVPREELWYCMRKSGVAEKYVRVVQDMYERSRTVVCLMDQLSEEVRQESPWTMMFADDIVICSESREQVEENLERWRFALERRGMKVSRSKTEYMCVNEREGSGTVRLQGEEVKKVQEFKYLGSTVQSNGECGKEVKKRVQAGWNWWRKVSGVLCDRKISARIKGKVYRTVVRAAMLYGLETVSLRKRQESELEVAELKMLRFSLGVTRLDRIRNEYIRGTAHVGRLGDKFREARLRWFGHVQRRDSEYIGRRMLDMGLPGRRQRGRPKRRYMDGINEDMKLVGARVEDAEDRDRWREMIRCGDP